MGLGARAKRLVKTVWRRTPEAARKPRQLWTIGVYEGQTPLDLQPVEDVQNPVVTPAAISDLDARFVADPFALRENGVWYLFFEVVGSADNRGRIGLATSGDARRWQYHGVVLSESFHLSYPGVFTWEGRHFMVPESGTASAVRLYEAEAFPTQWRCRRVLLEGRAFLDPSPFRWNGRWWMYAAEEHQGAHDTLRLFSSPELLGPWEEHPASPVISGDPRAARPAGRPQAWSGRLFRFAQDCGPRYGAAVRAFEITELRLDRYAEQVAQPDPIIGASGEGWNALGMHHLDLHEHAAGWVAFVDGRSDIIE